MYIKTHDELTLFVVLICRHIAHWRSDIENSIYVTLRAYGAKSKTSVYKNWYNLFVCRPARHGRMTSTCTQSLQLYIVCCTANIWLLRRWTASGVPNYLLDDTGRCVHMIGVVLRDYMCMHAYVPCMCFCFASWRYNTVFLCICLCLHASIYVEIAFWDAILLFLTVYLCTHVYKNLVVLFLGDTGGAKKKKSFNVHDTNQH
jgi:hypothetical protein